MTRYERLKPSDQEFFRGNAKERKVMRALLELLPREHGMTLFEARRALYGAGVEASDQQVMGALASMHRMGFARLMSAGPHRYAIANRPEWSV